MTGAWRLAARRVIAQVIEAMPEASERELRAAIRKAYPFGERHYYPYKVWLDEVSRQLQRRFQRSFEWKESDLFGGNIV